MKKLLAWGLTLTMLFTMTACGKSNNDTNSNKTTDPSETTSDKDESSKDLTPVTIVLDWTPNTNHTGLYVAQEKEYFEAAGLDVTIVQPPEDGATSMVASGQAQFGIDFQDYLAPVFTSEEKIPVTVVATLIQHNTSGIISRKDAGIESPKNMAGHSYATWELPVEQAMIENVVTEDGGDYSKVELIPEYVTDVPTALQTDIDSVWVYYAWDGIATKESGVDTNFFYFKDINPVFDYYNPVIITNDDYLAENPDTVKAFLDACRQGYEYAIANPEDAANILVEQVPELDKDIVTASQIWLADQYKAEVEQWGYIDQTRWDAFYTWLAENDLSPAIPAGYGFTNDYLPK